MSAWLALVFHVPQIQHSRGTRVGGERGSSCNGKGGINNEIGRGDEGGMLGAGALTVDEGIEDELAVLFHKVVDVSENATVPTP